MRHELLGLAVTGDEVVQNELDDATGMRIRFVVEI